MFNHGLVLFSTHNIRGVLAHCSEMLLLCLGKLRYHFSVVSDHLHTWNTDSQPTGSSGSFEAGFLFSVGDVR